MNMRYRTQNGFALLELVIAAAVIILVVGGGLWYAGRGERSRSTIEIGVDAQRRAAELAKKIQSRNAETVDGIADSKILFGVEARKFCGHEPPAICRPGMALGCEHDKKRWDCFPIPTDIDTSTWKTYRNEKYGFEVKYPSEWWANQQNEKLVVFSAREKKSKFEDKDDFLVLDVPADDEAYHLTCDANEEMRCVTIRFSQGEAVIQFVQTGHVIAEVELPKKELLNFSLMCDSEDWGAHAVVPYCIISESKVAILKSILSSMQFIK